MSKINVSLNNFPLNDSQKYPWLFYCHLFEMRAWKWRGSWSRRQISFKRISYNI